MAACRWIVKQITLGLGQGDDARLGTPTPRDMLGEGDVALVNMVKR